MSSRSPLCLAAGAAFAGSVPPCMCSQRIPHLEVNAVGSDPGLMGPEA